MATVIVNPDVHAALTREAAKFLAFRDRLDLGNGQGAPRLSTIERIELEAAARADASRLVDRLAEVLKAAVPGSVRPVRSAA